MRGAISMEDLQARVGAYAADCWDDMAPTREMGFLDGNTLRYAPQPGQAEALFNAGEGGEIEATVGQHAFGQLAERLDAPPTRWLLDERHVDGELRARVMNDMLQYRESVTVLLRHKADLLRAVLSDQYSVFNHTDAVDLVAGALGQMGDLGGDVQVQNPQVGDVLRAYVLLPRVTITKDPSARGGDQAVLTPDTGNTHGPRGHEWTGGDPRGNGGGLHPAVYLTNSEVGTGRVRIHGAMFRAVCSNGAIVGWKQGEGLDLVHRNLSRRTIASAMADALVEAFRMSEDAVNRFVASQAILLEPGKIAGLAREWGDKYGISLPNIEAWTKMVDAEAGANGRREIPALFDLVNAATFLAQSVGGADEREALERVGGDLLYAELPRAAMYGQVR
jgi:hypothetical protein